MSVRKLTASLLTALAMLGGAAMANAQEHFPAADPFAFDPDFRWFEPIYHGESLDVRPEKLAPTGWFATYDRLNLHVSRPELNEPDLLHNETALDNGWGHRYEFGYMLPDEDNGWMFTWTGSEVGEWQLVRQERLNRLNADDLAGDPEFPGPPFGFGEPRSDRNNINYNTRFYDIQDIENMLGYDAYELSKTWRLEPYHYGGILEPLVGLRWMRLHDINAFQEYTSSLEDISFVGPDGSPAELLRTNTNFTRNEMFGAQLGFRYFKRRDRFTFSGGFRAFFGGNWQISKSNQAETLTGYDAIGIDSDVLYVINTKTPDLYERNEEFFVGFDVRGQVEYHLTQMISIRGGFQLIDIGRGVWRGGFNSFVLGGDRDQDVLMFGGTFGLNLNH